MSRRVGLAGLAGVLNDIYMGEELRMGKKLWMEKKYTRKQITTQKRVVSKEGTHGEGYMRSRVTHREELCKEKLRTGSNNIK